MDENLLTADNVKTVLPEISDEGLKGLNEMVGKVVKKATDRARGEAWGLVDETLSTSSGIKKNEGEKTSDYVVRVYGEASKHKTTAETLQAKITDLETKIGEGKGSEAIKQQLKDAQTQLQAANEKIAATENEWKEKLTKKDSELVNIQLSADFSKARIGATFKETYSNEDIDILVKAKEDVILAKYKPDTVDGRIVFRDPAKNNEVVLDDKLNPATGAYLLGKEITPYLKESRQQQGSGATPTVPAGKANGFVLRATTQAQADIDIDNYVVGLGLDRRKPEFADKVTEIRKEMKVSSLPLQ